MANYLDETGLETVWECITDALDGYVKNDDSRLSDARIPISHAHSSTNITDFTSKVNSLIDAKLGVITNGTY